MVQSVIALASGTSLVNLGAGVIAPSVAYGINQLAVHLSRRRHIHAEETLNEAAEAAQVQVEQFIEEALSYDNRSELLGRSSETPLTSKDGQLLIMTNPRFP